MVIEHDEHRRPCELSDGWQLRCVQFSESGNTHYHCTDRYMLSHRLYLEFARGRQSGDLRSRLGCPMGHRHEPLSIIVEGGAMRKVALTVVICAVSGLFVAIRGSSVAGQAPATASTSQVSPDPTSWLGDDTPANAACDPDAVTVTSEDAASCAGAGYT